MFKGKQKDKGKEAKNKDKHTGSNGPSPSSGQADPPVSKPKLVFHCQQAHGSPTGVISEFTNVKELYQKIAECYDLTPNQVKAIARLWLNEKLGQIVYQLFNMIPMKSGT